MKITSVNNEKVIFWTKLKMKKYRDLANLFIVEGEHLVNEAQKKGLVSEIIALENPGYDYPVYEVSYDILKKITSLTNPPKVMAVCKYIVPDKITGNVLVLDHLQDPGNLGTIIRSAVAFDFKTIIMSNDTVDIYNDKVIRSSEGMIFNINIIKGSLEKEITNLKEEGYQIIGTDVIKGQDVRNLSKEKMAFVIGNEGNGLSNDIKKMCDNFIKLPMNQNCESLNAAVASSIIMYEVYHG